MRFLVWNCQGLGGSCAISQLEEISRTHSPDVVFLSETKNKSDLMKKVCRKLKFEDYYAVDPIGLSGGMALFWQQENIVGLFCLVEGICGETILFLQGISMTCYLQMKNLVVLQDLIALSLTSGFLSLEILFMTWVTRVTFGLGRELAMARSRLLKGTFSQLDMFFGNMECKIDQHMNQKLMLPITEKEVKKAVFSMKSHSAPGPDGGGVAVFDANYNLIEVWGRSFSLLGSALRAEAEVVRWALTIAKEKGWRKVQLKSDSQLLVSMIQSATPINPEVSPIILDIQHLISLFDVCQLLHFSRIFNIISHNVAKFSKSLVLPAYWTGSFPCWITSSKYAEEMARKVP